MVRRGVRSTLLLVLIGLVPVSTARATPLLPLAHGQLRVLLGQSGEWQPEAGTPETVTLISGAPHGSRASSLNAYVSLQRTDRSCPARPGGSALTLPHFYSAADRVGKGSALAPDGGAAGGVYAASADAGTLGEHRSVRACVWLAGSAHDRVPHFAQTIPLLNGLFAAAVFPVSGGYGLEAGAVGTSFSYAVESSLCGTVSTAGRVRVPVDQEASVSISVGTLNCPTDGSRFTFYAAHGGAIGVIPYTDAEPLIGHLGGCDLAGVSGLTLAAAKAYVTAVGCRVGRLLRAPYDRAVARGAVTEAQVDGGTAPLAPPHTTVDLVIDG